jgi:hypothetical protein
VYVYLRVAIDGGDDLIWERIDESFPELRVVFAVPNGAVEILTLGAEVS